MTILSEYYRNQSRRFLVERGRTIDLTIELVDATPLVFFEAPRNAAIFLNNVPVTRRGEPIPVEAGLQEARISVGDYTIIRTFNARRGKTYRVALALELSVDEIE